MVAASKKARGRDKQKFIAGTEPPSIPELDRAAESYVSLRDKRMNLTEDEVEAKTKLLEVMKDHKLEQYKVNGYTVIVTHGDDKVKVKKTEVGGDADPD